MTEPLPFVSALYQVMSNSEYADLISWTSNGTAIRIPDPVKITETLLPTVFRHNKFSSFSRQLNLYVYIPLTPSLSHGFTKVSPRQYVRRDTSAPDSSAPRVPTRPMVYAHKLFMRDDPDACRRIKRNSTPSSKKIKLKTKQAADTAEYQHLPEAAFGGGDDDEFIPPPIYAAPEHVSKAATYLNHKVLSPIPPRRESNDVWSGDEESESLSSGISPEGDRWNALVELGMLLDQKHVEDNPFPFQVSIPISSLLTK